MPTEQLKIRRKVNKDRVHAKGQGGHAARLDNRENRRRGVLDRLEAQASRGNKQASPNLDGSSGRGYEWIHSHIADLKAKWGW